ncbi:SRPBCC family protein [Kiloniella laminariae]|uniref:SRPBCC family protein n=1 Tax=Kiloniella laminariae TaxID=454162 RepID=A0ABT4LJR6_9PROT|nr:SRPBCC family protein [Kiloniella laminariae]MCZ4281345.1 SRPBCC family protein [Kiloniella laminariae]
MSTSPDYTLSITRVINGPRETVWRCWTETKLIKQWFCPKPWTVPEADLDARPGGRMNLVMAGPNGERIDTIGSFLEVIPQERLIFSDSYSEGFMPRAESFMTGVVELSDEGSTGTRMVWSARHSSEDARQKHLEMGFEQGWNAAADQLNELAQSLIANKEI